MKKEWDPLLIPLVGIKKRICHARFFSQITHVIKQKSSLANTGETKKSGHKTVFGDLSLLVISVEN